VSSDAHRPRDLDGYFTETFALLREIGCRRITRLSASGRVEEKL
jgi:hypothetical protein